MLTSGQLLAERYRLDHRIAVGGMGEVWQAVDVRLDRTVAVKVLKPELCGDAEFLHRFRTEARTTASLNHPGIAAVHDYGETAAPDGPQDTAYLVMELVEGEPLAAILAREGRITVEHTLDMLEQAGSALHAAHERGLVHRDVKPGNILVTPAGTIKITDFGIAKAADAAPVTRSGMVMGTAHYIAPEQALGGDATPSSDIYSLAVVGYECLKGHRPFLSDNAVTVAMMHIRELPPPLPPDVPPGARALIEATLTKDPRMRYSGGGEFAGAVAAVRSGRPLPTPAALTVPPQNQPQLPLPQNLHVGAPGPAGAHQTGAMPAPGGVQPQQNRSVSGPVSVPGQQTGPARGGPAGQTFPPGVVPPQGHAPGPQHAARARHRGRIGLWVFLAVFVVVIVVVVSFATWRVLVNGSSSHGQLPHPDDAQHATVAETRGHDDSGTDVRLVGSGSRTGHMPPRLRHPGVRHPGVRPCPAGRPPDTAAPGPGRRPAHHRKVADRRQAIAGNEVGGTAHRALVWRTSAVTGPRVGMTGRPWTRIGTTQR